MTLNDLFAEQAHFPSYYVVTFPGVILDKELNVIAADRELNKHVGTVTKTSNLNRNSLLIQVKTKEQGRKLMQLKTIAGHDVNIEP